jgi:hypothetical protein
MTVERVAILLGAIGVLACGVDGVEPSRIDSPAAPTGGTGASGGTGGTGGSAGCVSHAVETPWVGPGVHGTFNGLDAALNRVRQAGVSRTESGSAVFAAWVSSEPNACGPNSFTIAVATGMEELLPGSYPCGLPETDYDASTMMYALGNMTGTTPNSPDHCTIEITEAGTAIGAEVAGTFRGDLVGAGYRLDVSGEFRVPLTE